METYVNPGSTAFKQILDPNYVDMTGLIKLINDRVGGAQSLVCISRPRRFGKSYTARMLAAYYDCSCDSHALFDKKIISRTKGYEEHLNKYNVILIDITRFTSNVMKRHASFLEVPEMIEKAIWNDLIENGFKPKDGDALIDFMLRCVEVKDGKPFIFIIDEWDAMIRKAKDEPAAQKAYLNLLRKWFKDENFTPKAVAAVYMTGILPIKKDGSQSAISNFQEYTMLFPGEYAGFTGFSEMQEKGCAGRIK